MEGRVKSDAETTAVAAVRLGEEAERGVPGWYVPPTPPEHNDARRRLHAPDRR
jgi:hypothetical protein